MKTVWPSGKKGIVLVAILALETMNAFGEVDGVETSGSITFRAKEGFVVIPDGGAIHTWGYALDGGDMQYPGPTLLMDQGDTLTVNLYNDLPVPTSIVFPGQGNVAASGGNPGLLTQEAATNGGMVSYTFTASQPGTYLYQSGTRPDLQIEMGLLGAIIVRPSVSTQAYNSVETAFDREVLFLLTEMDPVIHEQVEAGLIADVDTTQFTPTYWFINGRCAPDTLLPAYAPWLPHQPYNCMPIIHPGEKLLMRMIGGGRDLHPFHHHGNNSTLIARDGRMLESVRGVSGPDLAVSDYIIQVFPGSTADALFEWTGKGMGWDFYGHAPGDPLAPFEDPADHGKPFPVVLPEKQDLAFGAFYSGSPFLGLEGHLPPGEGGLNPRNGFTFMWHSHNEKEMVNNNIFPGGMMTLLLVDPY